MRYDKILSYKALLETVSALKHQGKIIVQSHGIFDLIHPGVIEHLNQAKSQGDALLVTVVRDEDVRRGPGRPIFPAQFRAENAASLEQVDYVCIVDEKVPFECVKQIQPDVFARGQSLKAGSQHIHKHIFEEERELYLGKCQIYETDGFAFSSTQVIKNFLDIYPEETKHFVCDCPHNY